MHLMIEIVEYKHSKLSIMILIKVESQYRADSGLIPFDNFDKFLNQGNFIY